MPDGARVSTLPEASLTRSPRAEVLRRMIFGTDGDAGPSLGRGWCWPEPGFTWMLGPESDLTIEAPAESAPIHLVLRLAPFVLGGRATGQRLRVLVNDWTVFDDVVRQSCTLMCLVPAGATAGRASLRIRFEHPDYARPDRMVGNDDSRPVSLAVNSLRLIRLREPPPAGPARIVGDPPASDREVMLAFESLGDNCELGLVQRRAGVDPLSLLRFSATPVTGLLDMLESGLSGIADPALISLDPAALENGDHEYLLRHSRYGLTHHTLSLASQMDATRCKQREMTRLRVAERRMAEHLAAADRIFVYKHRPALPGGEVLALHLALRDWGANTLLHVMEADETHPPASVEVPLEGLMVGRVARFAPYEDAGNADDACWLAMCRRALSLWDRPG